MTGHKQVPLAHAPYEGDLSWREEAACRDLPTNVWFPENRSSGDASMHSENGDGRIAKRICKSCPVRVECLDFAVATHQVHGIWGGLSPGSRVNPNKKTYVLRRPAAQRTCSCGMTTAPGALSTHQKKTGHQGWTEVPDLTSA